ncbi:metal cation transporter, ZIP family protein [Toxoplasma gondii ME49]|uniref:Metal cation transporter, ZIP family protein n=12 Tax=Toxoplasma gondii TaxID=5811 RepID=B9PKE2_TOXGV|nr:metal cation transporter, ZIP family protein [Toxoplasma gondii ME49]EPR62693.1 metal cation transporter, ZIP family protein [Toxoplasma gondii GT1]ESS31987.1 metal cation transporter, ZIP family protein [Toxoplasma gondii VEG]KAF4641090.1 metal cation transporter, ZIP family protein [Toxoplasma gondii]KFG39543.1 metal cation transporter, ZIP family protein [Toxoplasma gondii p89]KFG49435.1 metal cation transporter, ZIP family protein [Toxoplasma gondii GAB2-2007-GAL-DOM2]KFG52730.1 metal |eukprot:XP_002365304.1 metal cation transporter, ZIP family protein [Toxoplasma gondii ME49]
MATVADDVMSAASWGSRVGAMVVLLCMGLLGAYIPLALRQCKLNTFIGILNTFAGGAFLGLAVFHIMPEAAEHIETADLFLEVGEGRFNMAYLFLFFGYLAILFCEQILTVDDGLTGHSHGHSAGHGLPEAEGGRGSGASISCSRQVSADRRSDLVPYESGSHGREREGERPAVTPCPSDPRDPTEGITEFSSTIVTASGCTLGEDKGREDPEDEHRGQKEGCQHDDASKEGCTSEDTPPTQESEQKVSSCPTEERIAKRKMNRIVPEKQEERSMADLEAGSCEHGQPNSGCRLTSEVKFDGTSFFLMVALAIHGLFEGMIVGAESNVISVWVVTSVIAGHKWAESLMLMSQFIARGVAARWSWVLMGAFVASSPIGVLIGVALRSEGALCSGVANALGAGTLLYVAAETSTSVFTGSRGARVGQLLIYCLGASMVLGLTLVDLALDA